MLVAMMRLCTVLVGLALALPAALSSCSDGGRTRWEYKLVAVSELVGEAAFNAEEVQELFPDAMQDPLQAEEAWQEAVKRIQESDAALLRGLNDLGADGWEVVSMESAQSWRWPPTGAGVVLLKRRAK